MILPPSPGPNGRLDAALEPTRPPMRKALSELIFASRDRVAPDALVEQAARKVASFARDEGMRAEQMIVRVKHEWVEITGPGPPAPDDPLRDAQSRLISECIRSFYDLDGAPSKK